MAPPWPAAPRRARGTCETEEQAAAAPRAALKSGSASGSGSGWKGKRRRRRRSRRATSWRELTECGKSGYYVRPAADGTGIMFLGETSLGAEHHISQDGQHAWGLRAATLPDDP